MKSGFGDAAVKGLQIMMVIAAGWGLVNAGGGWSDRIVQQGYYTDAYFVSGTVSGLEGDGLVLSLNNGAQVLPVAANGVFKFAQELPDASQYEVEIAFQPSDPGQTCSLNNAVGTINGADVRDIEVTCETDTYSLSISVNGVAGSGLVIESGTGDQFNVPGDTTLFVNPIPDGTSYNVRVLTHPTQPSQTCDVVDGLGQISGANAAVAVNCQTDTFVVGGTVSGLSGQGLVLRNNPSQEVGIVANGPFAFPALPDQSAYDVIVRTHPVQPAQTCTVVNGGGFLAGQDVSDIEVVCETLEADLAITKSDGKDTIVPGQPIDYLITVSNIGDMDVSGARVVDILPVELEDASWICVPGVGAACPTDGVGGIDAFVDLAAGATADFVLTATVRDNFEGIVENTATVTGPPGVTEVDLANNSATDRSAGIAVFADGFEPILFRLKQLLESR